MLRGEVGTILSAISASVFILGWGTDGSALEEEESFAEAVETLTGRSASAFSTTPV
jgi:hypothetical protein